MAPVLVAAFMAAPEQWRDILCALLFFIASITDFLDGLLARHFKITSRFGQFLDPVADKIIVITALLLLVDSNRAPFLAVLIIIGREICVLGLREWMAELGKINLVTPSMLGKCKTIFQMLAIILLLYQADVAGVPVVQAGEILLWIAALLTVISMIYYLRAAAHAAAE